MDKLCQETIEALHNGPYAAIIEAIGPEHFISLCKVAGGAKVYIPKVSSVSRNERNRKIYCQFDGGNVAQLAMCYNLSETHIRRIIEKVKEDNHNGIH